MNFVENWTLISIRHVSIKSYFKNFIFSDFSHIHGGTVITAEQLKVPLNKYNCSYKKWTLLSFSYWFCEDLIRLDFIAINGIF